MNPHITRADSVQEPPTVLGFLEEATLFPGGFRIHAKLDTGADTSSIHAEEIEIFQKGKKEYARFRVSNRYGESYTYERQLLRHAQIKSKRGKAQSRPVVRIGICVGGIKEFVEVTLVDRSNFSSAALIGRNFLSGKILVDPSSSYTTDEGCNAYLRKSVAKTLNRK